VPVESVRKYAANDRKNEGRELSGKYGNAKHKGRMGHSVNDPADPGSLHPSSDL